MKQDLGSHKPMMMGWNSYYMMTNYTGCNFYQQEIEKHVPWYDKYNCDEDCVE